MAKDTAGPNAGQIGLWNDATGKTWAMLHERLDRQIAPIGQAAMAKAAFQPGERVLDVGCGCGETTVEIAGRVAPGEVLGADVSGMLLDIAREAAKAKGANNVRFIEADAQAHAFPAGGFDVLFSRFGVMFFDDPPTAFANLRKALKPGGRLAFCCWRTPPENEWMSLPLRSAAHLLPPPQPGDPDAPGPFAFADKGRVASILASAGFDGVTIEPLDLEIGADSLEDSVAISLRVGPLGSTLRQIEASDQLKRDVEDALRRALAPHLKGGLIRLPAAVWIVSARNPA
jgi:SAM-dependent methyltransferase